MNPVIRKLHEAQLRKDLPEFRSGDTVKVHVRLLEGEGEKVKERIQTFEGVVISKKGRASSATFTVRRVSFGTGVERFSRCTRPASLRSTWSARAMCAVRACITSALSVARPPASSAPPARKHPSKPRPKPQSQFEYTGTCYMAGPFLLTVPLAS